MFFFLCILSFWTLSSEIKNQVPSTVCLALQNGSSYNFWQTVNYFKCGYRIPLEGGAILMFPGTKHGLGALTVQRPKKAWALWSSSHMSRSDWISAALGPRSWPFWETNSIHIISRVWETKGRHILMSGLSSNKWLMIFLC